MYSDLSKDTVNFDPDGNVGSISLILSLILLATSIVFAVDC